MRQRQRWAAWAPQNTRTEKPSGISRRVPDEADVARSHVGRAGRVQVVARGAERLETAEHGATLPGDGYAAHTIPGRAIIEGRAL